MEENTENPEAEPTETEPTEKDKEDYSVLKGITVSNLFALLVIGISRGIAELNPSLGGIFIASDFILVPLVMGIICAYFWRDLKRKTGNRMLLLFTNLSVTLALSMIFLGEGVLCLIIVSPLIFVFMIVGELMGHAMYKRNNNKLNMSVVGLLAVLFFADLFTASPLQREVRDEVVIHATPAEIWPHVVAFDPIPEKPSYWLFRLGMPMPMQTTVEGYYAGAGRKCIFNDKIIFDEKMVVFEPGVNLTFDILKQPDDPEIIGHIDIQRGQFLLKDNGNGTTTLVGTSWYVLKVLPAWYYDLWAESITRNVHLRVMEHVKLVSEQKN